MLLKKNIPFKYVFGKIKYEIIAIAVYATIIAILYNYSHITKITIPLAIPAILGTVISLLLGFRSNQAYDRWWEARHIWGAIVNDSRSLSRQVMSFTYNNYHSEDVETFRQRVIRRQIGWCYALGRHLRKQDALKGLDKYISPDELDALQGIENIPSALLDNMGSDLH
ncbi:MAG TPA: bestrophin family ion channel, partial [Niabella sp.]|nr:bestrophin family ion channel [Niabella sp.]